MASANDITSTEKLLDLIRKKKPDLRPAAASESKPAFRPPRKRVKLALPKALPTQRNITVGVDISHDSLRLVKTRRAADNKRELLEYQAVPLPTRSRRGTPEFINFLKTELTRFCGIYQRVDLWAIMSAANVNVRHIRIPKVAKGEIENVVFWSVKKEAPFNEKETLMDFEVLDEIADQGVPKWLVMAYTAPRREVEEIRDLFVKAGFPLMGVSIVPFAVQNIFRTGWMPALTGTDASLFIGNDFSRIDIYSRGNLIMTRGIKAGINSMVEAIQEALSEQGPAIEARDAATPVTTEEARKVLFSMSPDSAALSPQDPGYALSAEEKHRIIVPALERLVRQIDRTFEYYKANVDQEQVSRIFVSTAMNIYRPLIDYVGEQLAIESDVLNPIDPHLPDAGEEIQESNLSERVTLTPALGMALSDKGHTPNLLFTYKDKQLLVKTRRASLAALGVLAVVAALCTGFFLYEMGILAVKNADIDRLQRELAQFQPRLNQNDLMQMATKAKQQKYSARTYSDRYRSLAVIGELSALTPTNIRLVNLKADFAAVGDVKPREAPKTAPPPEAKEAAKEPSKEPAPAAGAAGSVAVEGVILGSRQSLESSLADYITKLQASPLFRQVTLQKNTIERVKRGDVLRFTISMKVASA